MRVSRHINTAKQMSACKQITSNNTCDIIFSEICSVLRESSVKGESGQLQPTLTARMPKRFEPSESSKSEASPLAYRSLDSPNKNQKDCSLTSAKETAQPFHYSCTTSSMARGWLKAGDEYKQFILESLLNASE